MVAAREDTIVAPVMTAAFDNGPPKENAASLRRLR
jgi:hypothetical protein